MKRETLSSKERMIIAMRHGKPDRVPVAPDISNMVPCRLTGKPFWDIYQASDPPLWKAYVQAVEFFGFDGWHIYAHLDYVTKNDQRTWKSEEVSRSDERYVIRTTCGTPAGDLWQETTYYIADPPTHTGWGRCSRWISSSATAYH